MRLCVETLVLFLIWLQHAASIEAYVLKKKTLPYYEHGAIPHEFDGIWLRNFQGLFGQRLSCTSMDVDGNNVQNIVQLALVKYRAISTRKPKPPEKSRILWINGVSA